ncbi:DUF6461 domain-containing protein [Rhodococcus sp. NyZ502]|uniref:DUF6461 domain-containing protein n=1 Tax=Rhodococcus sp. NyZ502 TaxID=3242855 RepID=UPI0035568099
MRAVARRQRTRLGRSSVVGAEALGNWTIAFVPMASAAADDDLVVPLTVGCQALTHSRNVATSSSFVLWQNGVRARQFMEASSAELDILWPAPEEYLLEQSIPPLDDQR